jgi:ABC-2 type transport system ATP-binding protein
MRSIGSERCRLFLNALTNGGLRMIDILGLKKQFGDLEAVAGVSFSVDAAQTFGLLGPNGAGKTTTIHMLAGVLKPDAGSITVAGQTDPSRPDVRRAIGFAPQQLALYVNLTAEENLRFFAKLYGLAADQLQDRIEWALEFSRLTDRRRSRVKTFSGGMQRRLNLAVAMIHDPQIILLDEPTVGVDPQSRNHIFESIEELKQQGRTIVYTTHYMDEAQRLCDRVAIMDHGRILDLDTVDELIDRHGGDARVTVEFREIPDIDTDLPAPLDGRRLQFETDQPLDEIGRLASHGRAFQSLEINRPDLERVFLNLTGRSLRD